MNHTKPLKFKNHDMFTDISVSGYALVFLLILSNINCKAQKTDQHEINILPNYTQQYEDMKKVNAKDNVITAIVRDTLNQAYQVNDLAKDQITVIKIWATWCSPCIESMPKYEALRKKHPHIRFITISIDQKYEHWKEMIDKKNWNLDQYWAEGSEKSQVYHLAYELSEGMVTAALANYVILDKNGMIIENIVTDENRESNFNKALERISQK
jgi:thiol-disulfide isomerase/thioredoxin